MFPIHHILAQLFADHRVIKLLAERFNKDAIENRMALPPKQWIATDLSSSPHTGGHLGTYYNGFRTYLKEVEQSPRFNAALAGDPGAQDELVSDLNGLVAAAKYALANGHLFANTPVGMTTGEANDENNKWFTNWRKYSEDHQAKIQQMQETVDQYHKAGQLDAALHWPLLSPTSGLSMAERIDILKRVRRDGSPISLHFTPVGPVPGLPGLVPPFVDTRLPGFIPPSLAGLNQPEGFTPSNPLLTYGLPGFPAASADWERLMEVPPSTAEPQEQQVLQFHSETGQPLTFSDGSQVLGPPAPADDGSAWLMGAGVIGAGALMIPGAQWLGPALLAGATAAAVTRPAFSASILSNTKAAEGALFSGGADPYNPFGVNRSADSREKAHASTFADRFGNWAGSPAGTMPAQDAPGAPSTPAAAGAIAPAEVRRLTRVNELNAGSVFTSGSAPVPYLPSTEFNERFGNWTTPTADGRSPQTSKPTGAFADEPSYLIPPPIFGVDGLGRTPHNDADEWFSRWIRPLLPPE